MTLRDWFAGMALQGILQNDQGFNAKTEAVAEWAYEAADAMLTARKEKA